MIPRFQHLMTLVSAIVWHCDRSYDGGPSKVSISNLTQLSLPSRPLRTFAMYEVGGTIDTVRSPRSSMSVVDRPMGRTASTLDPP